MVLREFEREKRRALVSRFLDGTDTPHLIEVPTPLSIQKAEWFRRARIGRRLRVYAFPAFGNGIFSGKLYAAAGLFNAAEKAGRFYNHPWIVSATSGNLGKDGGSLALLYPTRGFKSVVNYGTPLGKIHHVQASGARVMVTPEGVSAIDYAYELCKRPDHLLMEQYTDEGSIEGHRWSMAHIASEMRRFTDQAGFIFGAVMGTCSTLVAAHRYLRSFVPGEIKILGVSSMSKKEKVPGSRSPQEIAELKKICGFPFRPEWASVLNFPVVANVTKHEAFSLNPELCRQTFRPVGPTGALLAAGAYRLLRDYVERGEMEALVNERGLIEFVLFWMDSNLAYIGDPDYLKYFKGSVRDSTA